MSRNFNKKLSAFIALALISSNAMGIGFRSTAKAETLATDLFISEYVEGSGQNKVIEIYNGTGQSVDLSKYKLQSDKDGNDIFVDSKYPKEVTLSGTLNNGEVVVVYNKSMKPEDVKKIKCNKLIADTKFCVFNGNDQVRLLKDEKEIDRIGIKGGSNFAADVTLVRKPIVNSPKSGEQDPTKNGEWTSFSKDDLNHLGEHTMGAETKVSRVTASKVGNVYAGTEVTLSTSTKDADIYYTTDNSEPTIDKDKKYVNPIVINKDTTLKAIAVKNGLENSDVEIFEYTVKPPLQLMSIKDARILPKDAETKIEGIVTADFGDQIFVQDDTAGIIIYFKGLDLNIGDKVSVEGKITQFYDMAEIVPANLSDVKLIKANFGAPTPKIVKTSDIIEKGEELEEQLVEIKNATITEMDSNGNFRFKDEEIENPYIACVKPLSKTWIQVGKTYDSIIGVMNYDHGEYKVMSRTPVDILEDENTVRQVIATPGSGIIEKGKTVTLATATTDAKVYYTVDGTEPTEKNKEYTEPIVINEDTTIKALAVKAGLKPSDVITLKYTAKNPGESIRIREIQGSSHSSLFKGKVVEGVKGVVTAISNDYYQKGFYIQDTESDNDDRTSEGIFIDTKDFSKVKVGDLVSIKGKVDEKPNGLKGDTNGLTITEIMAYGNDINVISSDNKLPEPVVLGKGGRVQPTAIIDNDSFSKFDPEEDAIDFYESIEGMRVKINDPLVIGKDERYGEIAVLPDNGERAKDKKTVRNGITITKENFNPEIITIDDVLVPLSSKDKKYIDHNFSVKVGDKFKSSITAIASYGMGNYKFLNVDKLPEIVDGGNKREVTDIVTDKDKLTIASFNIENFSANENKVGKEEGTSKEKVVKVAEDIIKNLNTPDIVGLVEVQDSNGMVNDGTTDGAESYKKLINEIKAQGGPEYAYTEIAPINNQDGGAPGGNIRVGYIYNKARVKLVEKQHGDALTAVDYNKDGLTLNPGRIEPTNAVFDGSRKSLAVEFEFNGEKVVVIANHLSSKRGDEGLYGVNQPPVRGSEPNRHAQAQVINNFIDKVLSVNSKANIVVLGDLNDFEFSETVDILKGKGNEKVLTNVLDLLPKNERYSYVYQGNSQVLDNVLVNNALVPNTKADVVHINSEFEESHGRVSDHDPLLIQVKLDNKEIPNQNDKKDINIEFLTSKEELVNLKVGDDVKIKIKATNNFDKNQYVTLILALYDENNRFLTYVPVRETVGKKGNKELQAMLKILPKCVKVKCFVWDTLENMTPLTNVMEVKVNK